MATSKHRIRRAYKHLIDLDTEEMWRELESPDPIWHWSADYPGRWIASMAYLNLLLDEKYDVATAADRLIGYQLPDGSFGRFTSPHGYKEWFGMGRGLVGLLEYHVATGDEAALDSARRLGDYYVANTRRTSPTCTSVTPTRWKGWCCFSALTGDRRYADNRSPDGRRHRWSSGVSGNRLRSDPAAGGPRAAVRFIAS